MVDSNLAVHLSWRGVNFKGGVTFIRSCPGLLVMVAVKLDTDFGVQRVRSTACSKMHLQIHPFEAINHKGWSRIPA